MTRSQAAAPGSRAMASVTGPFRLPRRVRLTAVPARPRNPVRSVDYRYRGRTVQSPGLPRVTHCGMQVRVMSVMRRMVPGSHRS